MILVETWPALADLAGIRETILARTKERLREALAQDAVDGDIHVVFESGFEVLATKRARPHVDSNYPEWTALWVLESHGHYLSIADHVPRYRAITVRRQTRARGYTTTRLETGNLVLFNAHRTHWMDAVPGAVMVAASFDFVNRPTRDDVEGRIRDACGAEGVENEQRVA